MQIPWHKEINRRGFHKLDVGDYEKVGATIQQIKELERSLVEQDDSKGKAA